MTLEPGWLKRQCDAVEADLLTWPPWMREAAGLEKLDALERGKGDGDGKAEGNG
jgi:hypothetical protein